MQFRSITLGDWCVEVSESLLEGIWAARIAATENETGGIIVGSWDRAGKRVYIVGHFSPPPDSVSNPTTFVRGAKGVYRTLEALHATTVANLTYIGEWHTHPRHYQSYPSSDDRLLLRWIGQALMFSDVPPLMIIAGNDGVRIMLGSEQLNAILPMQTHAEIAP
jgi:integrative and conjugative element protein (TIGR02256 family)